MDKSKKPTANFLNIFLIVSTLIILFLVAHKALIFGSISGKWVYPYFLTNLMITPVLICLVLSTLVTSSVYFSKQYIGKYEVYVLISWFIIGFVVQAALRVLYPFSFEQIIRSDFANAFYNLTLQYSPLELLSRYDEISKTLPFHTVTNMPGKILFFYLLRIFTNSAQVMGYLIIIFSNLGAILIYYICKYIFKDRLIALYSLILYFLFPAKIFFFPILNTVSPVFIFLCLFFMLKYFINHKSIWLFLMGFSLYIVFIFEPLVLTSGIIFLALLIKYYLERIINSKQLGKVIIYPLLFFMLAHLLLFLIFKYNVFRTFTFTFNNQIILNQQMQRSYSVWLIQNLKNFFINAGFLQSILFITLLSVFIYGIIRNLKRKSDSTMILREFLLKPGVLVTFAFAILIITLDLLGITKGEIIRLWIFMMVFLQIVASYFCVAKGNTLTFYIVVISNIFQTALTLNMVAFVIP